MTAQELSLVRRAQTANTVPPAPLLIGSSDAMQRLREDVDAAARSDAKVLIVGETGVGKEIVARMIHETGRRRTRNFVTINCAGLPDSLLESELFGHVRGSFTGAYRDKPGLAAMAHNGTLFLDELGETSLRMQALLLRFVENGEIQRVGSDRIDGRVDVRIIAATNRNLAKRIGEGEFREDLYYRLNVIRLAIPPLRERGDDVTMLLRHYLSRECDRASGRSAAADADGGKNPDVAPLAAATSASSRTSWSVSSSVIRGRDIVPDDLPAEILDAVTFAGEHEPAGGHRTPQIETKSRAEHALGHDGGRRRELLDRRVSGVHRSRADQRPTCVRSSRPDCSGRKATIGSSSSCSGWRRATTSASWRSSISTTAICRSTVSASHEPANRRGAATAGARSITRVSRSHKKTGALGVGPTCTLRVRRRLLRGEQFTAPPISSGDAGADEHERRRFGHHGGPAAKRRIAEDLELDAGVGEVTVGVETQRDVAAVVDVVERC